MNTPPRAQAAGERVSAIHVPDCTHFSVLEDLTLPDGVLMKAVRASMTV